MDDAPPRAHNQTQACIVHTDADHKRLSWCGRKLAREYVWESLDAAVYGQVRTGRLTLCPDCMAAAVNALSLGNAPPGWAPAPPQTGGLVLDLSPVRAYTQAVEALEQAWADVPAAARPGLSTLLWMHPNGEMVAYRVPGEPAKDGR